MEDRRSVDKTSTDSPSRLYMRSLMDHSNKDTTIKSDNKQKKPEKKNSKMKANLKLTGKSIIESS